MSRPELRDYQLEAVAAIRSAFDGGVCRPLLALPTGAGKTVVFAELIRDTVATGGRALVLVHRRELIEQAREKLAQTAPDVRVGIVKAERDEHDAPVVIASVQTVYRPERLRRLGTNFQLAVVDEAHHAVAPSWQTVLEALKTVPTLGVTATPFRGDGSSLRGLFDAVAYQKRLVDMIPRWLVDIRSERVQVRADFTRLHTVGGEINQGEAATMLLNANAPKDIVAAYEKHAIGRRALCFTPTIAVAEAVAAAFRSSGIPAEALSDKSSDDERHAILGRLRRGETLVVPNCTILTEGFDCPDVSCVIIARPTRSKQLYVQMLGRGTRKAADKTDCLILDTVGATERHDLQSLAAVLGVAMKPGETFTEARERGAREQQAAEEAEDAREFARREIVSRTVHLLHQRTLHCASSADGTLLVLSLGPQQHIRVVRDSTGGWSAFRQHGKDDAYRCETLAAAVDIQTAVDTAEQHATIAETNGKAQSRLLEKNAGWRSWPADAGSPQVELAGKVGIACTPKTTKGELSDALAVHFARQSEAFRTGQRKPRYVPFWVSRSPAATPGTPGTPATPAEKPKTGRFAPVYGRSTVGATVGSSR